MLVECGFTRAITNDGREYTFRPSFGRLAELGTPHDLIALYAALYGPRADDAARSVLAGLCDQDDPLPLIGGEYVDAEDHTAPARVVPGLMPPTERVIVARHLMQHGMVGTATPEKGDGQVCDRFDATQFVAIARVHLGMSAADAEALSMTELQQLLAMKYPDAAAGPEPDMMSAAEYDALMARMQKRGAGNG